MVIKIDINRKDEIYSVIKKNSLYTSNQFYVRKYMGKYFLATRQHDLGGVDWNFLMTISEDESVWLSRIQTDYSIGEWK